MEQMQQTLMQQVSPANNHACRNIIMARVSVVLEFFDANMQFFCRNVGTDAVISRATRCRYS